MDIQFNPAGKNLDGDDIALPLYQCHKKVWALKIANIEPEGHFGPAMITPADPRYAPFKVSAEYVQKHKPEIGGWWVRYPASGGSTEYESWSPSGAFEEGYSRVVEQPSYTGPRPPDPDAAAKAASRPKRNA